MHESQAFAPVSHRFHLTPKLAASKMPRRGKLLHPLLLTLALLCHGEMAKVARPVDGTGPSGLTLGLESARTHGPSRQTHGGGSMPWQTQSGLARLPCQEPALRYVHMRSLPNPHALCAGSDGNRRGSQGDSLGTCPAGTADAAAADPKDQGSSCHQQFFGSGNETDTKADASTGSTTDTSHGARGRDTCTSSDLGTERVSGPSGSASRW